MPLTTSCNRLKYFKNLFYHIFPFVKWKVQNNCFTVSPLWFTFTAKFRKEFQAVLRLSRCRCSSRKIRIPSVLTSSKNKSSLPRTEGYELNIDNSKQSWIKSSTIRKEQNPQEKYGWNMMNIQPRYFLWSRLIGWGVQR